jgi:hypothetical protein
LNLSGFSLNIAQIEHLVVAVKGIKVLDLSYILTMDIDTVRFVLETHPQLKRLVLLGCPQISLLDIQELLCTKPELFIELEALIHPALLGELNNAHDHISYLNAFSFIGIHQYGFNACSLPFFSPPHVIQALTDSLGLLDRFGYLGSRLPIQAAFSSARVPGQPWSERSTVIIPHLSLPARRGEGWAFVHQTTLVCYQGKIFNSYYAFIRKNSPESDWETYDLVSFVKQVMQDGRPHPTDEAVDKLQKILDNFQAELYSSHTDIEAFMRLVDRIV